LGRSESVWASQSCFTLRREAEIPARRDDRLKILREVQVFPLSSPMIRPTFQGSTVIKSWKSLE
jgi:hypothetical protein